MNQIQSNNIKGTMTKIKALNAFHFGTICKVIYDFKTDQLITCTGDGAIIFRSYKTNDITKSAKIHKNWVNDIIMITLKESTQIKLITASSDKTIVIWNFDTLQHEKILAHQKGGVLSLLKIKVKNNWIILSGGDSNDKTLHMWDIQNLKYPLRQTLQQTGPCWCMIQVKTNIIIASNGNNLNFYIMNTKLKLIKTLTGHKDDIRSIVDIGRRNQIISCSDDCLIKLWNIYQGSCLKNFIYHNNWVTCLSIINHRYLISGGWDQKICLWNLKKKKPKQIIKSGNEHIYHIAEADQNNLVVVGGSLGTKYIEIIHVE